MGCGSCEQCVDSVVAGVRTWWRHGVCVWGGVKRQRSGTPSWGERVCVCGTHRGGGGFGEQRRGRVNAVNAAPFLGCWWILWEGVWARTGTQGRGEPWRGGPLVCGQGVNRGGMRGCAHGSLMGACERQRARGLGSGGAGPEGVVKRQRSGARSVPWGRPWCCYRLGTDLLACDPWAGSPGGPGVWVPCLGVQGGVVRDAELSMGWVE